jgi:RNA polymerase sigma factor (sigma-70 family)
VEASALTHAQRRGLFARRSPLLKLQSDDSLVALTRRGHQHAFDALVHRYQARLLGFCRQMLRSTEDAEDVLQEVFVAAYNAMIADERPIAVRPWLYRIARNRSLNHLRKPTADGQDTMDIHPHMHGVTTLERVQSREEFRNLVEDVGELPETQRTALLLREMDAMSYEEIAQAMDQTVPGVKSLLVRARIALAESSQSRHLTCDEVRLQLAEASEGLAKADGPVRRHVKGCESCKEFRTQLRSDAKAMAALFPVPLLLVAKSAIAAKLSGLFGGGGAAAGGTAGATGASATAGAAGAGATAAGAGTAAATGAGAALGGAAAGGAAAAGGGVASAIGAKAAAGFATAALLTAGAVEVRQSNTEPAAPAQSPAAIGAVDRPKPKPTPPAQVAPAEEAPATPTEVTVQPVPVAEESQASPPASDPAAGESRHPRPGQPVAEADGGAAGGVSGVGGSTSTGGGVSTGTEPVVCDADGDGVTDPGADPSCPPAPSAPPPATP